MPLQEAQVAGYKSLCVERDEALRVSKSEASAAHVMLADAARSRAEAALFTDLLAEDAKATDAAYVSKGLLWGRTLLPPHRMICAPTCRP